MKNKHLGSLTTHYLLVPVHICDLVIARKSFREFQIYMFLKAKFSGQAKLTPADIESFARQLGISKDTIDNSITTLRKWNWIGYNPKSGYYFFRGFEKIKQIEKLRSRSAVWLATHKDIRDFHRFKAFVIGVSFGNLVKKQKWGEVCKLNPEQLKGSSYHRLSKRLPSHFPLACNALAKIFNISVSTASVYKKLAKKYKFLSVRRNQKKITSFNLMDVEKKSLKGSGIPARFVHDFKEAYPEYAKRVRIKEGYLYLDEPDTAKPLMEFKRKHVKRA